MFGLCEFTDQSTWGFPSGSPKTKLCPMVGSGNPESMDHPKNHSLFGRLDFQGFHGLKQSLFVGCDLIILTHAFNCFKKSIFKSHGNCFILNAPPKQKKTCFALCDGAFLFPCFSLKNDAKKKCLEILLTEEILQQLRLVAYPIIYRVSNTSQVVGNGISSINSSYY